MPRNTTSSLQARYAAQMRWANEDPTKQGEIARAGLLAKFEREVDPEGILDPAERARRAESARKAFYTRLALKSAQARRKPDRGTAA